MRFYIKSLRLITIVFSTLLLSKAENYRFGKLNINNGLSDNQVNCIFKDSKGFMWFGNRNGLNRFDGFRIKTYRHNENDSTSIIGDHILSISESFDGKLWMNTFSGKAIFDLKTERFYRKISDIYPDIKFDEEIISYFIDGKKNLWLVGNKKVYRYEIANKLLRSFYINRTSIAKNGKIASIQSKDNKVWLLYRNGYLEEYSYDKFILKSYYNPFASKVNQYNDLRMKLFVDSADDIWIFGLGVGVSHFNKQAKSWELFCKNSKRNRLSSDMINFIAEDKKGRIWIATDQGGVNIYNKQTGDIQHISNDNNKEFSLSHNTIISIYCDDLGIVWLGTFKQGLCYYHPNLFKFEQIKANPYDVKAIPFNDINTLLEDKNGNLWIGSDGKGLAVKSPHSDRYTLYNYNAQTQNSIPSNVIVSLKNDPKGNVWIGSYSGGLAKFDGRSFVKYTHSTNDKNTISSNNIWDIEFEPNGNLWLATLGGGVDGFTPTMKKNAHFDIPTGTLNSDYVLSLLMDYPRLFIGTAYGLSIYNIREKRFEDWIKSDVGKSVLLTSHINLIYKDSRGLYWFGTAEGLDCYNPINHKFIVYSESDGLPDNVIHTLVEDKNSVLWISTVKGLCRIELIKEAGEFKPNFTVYGESDGLQHGSLNLKAALCTSNNYIYFGGTDGLNYFRPADLAEQIYEGNIVITDFQIYNHSIQPGVPYNGRKILENSITSTNKIELSYDDNFFSVEFASLNYYLPKVTHYLYKLEGFNSQWIRTNESSHTATFTNLSPGKYTFLVKAVYKGGKWSNKTGKLTIIVLPPWWLSGWAISLYFVLFVLISYFTYRIVINRIAENKQKMEAEKEHKLDEMKLQFFTNISHEFRTPLTLIITPLDKLINETFDVKIKKQLEMMSRNAKQLLTLVNQVLEFRKLEVATPAIIYSQGDIIDFLQNEYNAFSDAFIRKSIRSNFYCPVSSLWVSFDNDKLHRIISNLLSNALKFTNENGEIKLEIWIDIQPQCPKATIQIDVTDTGIGISEEHIEKVFDSFYQVPQTTQSLQGSGVGLHLVKKYVELMGGTIALKSKSDEGCVFSIIFAAELVESTNFVPNEILQDDDSLISPTEANLTPMATLLIVEDNDDLRSFLSDNLKMDYQIIEANDGEQGFEMAKKIVPDLIITDLMMPILDGMEMSKLLKSNLQTSHIPILMLTAKSSDEARLESLKLGIEDYITKPFNLESLLLKVRNIQLRQSNSQKNFQQKIAIDTSEVQVTSLDEKLIQNAVKAVEDNISNSEFSVEELSKMLNMSRVNLYKKLLSLTGKTPIEFIRIIRLRRAVQLLEKSQLNIAEIAYEVGFNTPRYFSRYFKEEYGENPTTYLEKLRRNSNLNR